MVLEAEMLSLSKEVWEKIAPPLKTMPRIESKQGGSSGCFYPDRYTVYYRWNVWNKLGLAGKRMLVIHELYHALGHHHKGMFLHAFDILTIELYKKIYGEDEEYQKMVEEVRKLI